MILKRNSKPKTIQVLRYQGVQQNLAEKWRLKDLHACVADTRRGLCLCNELSTQKGQEPTPAANSCIIMPRPSLRHETGLGGHLERPRAARSAGCGRLGRLGVLPKDLVQDTLVNLQLAAFLDGRPSRFHVATMAAA